MKAYTPEQVREIEEMLKEVKAWHQGDHFRFGDSEQRESWVSHKEGIETALATLRSGQEMEQEAWITVVETRTGTSRQVNWVKVTGIAHTPLYAIKPSKD
jgi:DNA primase catalytic subunit